MPSLPYSATLKPARDPPVILSWWSLTSRLHRLWEISTWTRWRASGRRSSGRHRRRPMDESPNTRSATGPESTPADVHTNTVEGTETVFWLNDLTASTRYMVDVRAATAKGEGPREEVRFMSGVPPELPGRPSALAVTEVKARSVQLSFNPGFDGHSPIRTWHVEAKQGEGRTGIFAAVFNTSAPRARTLTVSGLRPHTHYQLRLIAENVKGRGAPSEATKMFKTSPAAPDAPSSKLWAEPTSATSITLSWTPLQTNQWNGDPIGYLIVYRKAPRTGSNRTRSRSSEEIEEEEEREGEKLQHELRTHSLRATEITLKDLAPWTNYELELYAENVVGRSSASGASVRARTYESAPRAAPADIRVEPRGERGAIVQWSEVPRGGAGGEIVGYTVRLTPSDGLPEYRKEELSRVSQIASPDQLTESFSNLRAATTYKVRIRRGPVIGEGPPSMDALVRTRDDIPAVRLVSSSPSSLPPKPDSSSSRPMIPMESLRNIWSRTTARTTWIRKRRR
ncbi:hypothetical protein PENTCL1PPCAC_30335 [Pristionchus entomophagus]|uniref:Fibronectin type-III domain-containing protein n=1 Tax=Pristionchus entomophagus TaxID=358040 RepID=A0AAV5UM41_9BILA|nr:hypothetical protein PENTCL1PPCAC_30335 [Pristionchus entomophagus]